MDNWLDAANFTTNMFWESAFLCLKLLILVCSVCTEQLWTVVKKVCIEFAELHKCKDAALHQWTAISNTREYSNEHHRTEC